MGLQIPGPVGMILEGYNLLMTWAETRGPVHLARSVRAVEREALRCGYRRAGVTEITAPRGIDGQRQAYRATRWEWERDTPDFGGGRLREVYPDRIKLTLWKLEGARLCDDCSGAIASPGYDGEAHARCVACHVAAYPNGPLKV